MDPTGSGGPAPGQRLLQTQSALRPLYGRTTELRHVLENDMHKLNEILDESDCWRQLMEIIPKRLDSKASSEENMLRYEEAIEQAGFKYTASDISQIERAYSRMNAYQYHSQIMFEEWQTSGRTNERPTLGVLLQLLIHAELFHAADFVAEKLLNESKPQRPSTGPAAPVDFDDLNEESMDIDFDAISLPNTNALNENAHIGLTDAFNIDYSKRVLIINKDMPVSKPDNVPPVPPPRLPRKRQQSRSNNDSKVTTVSTSQYENQLPDSTIEPQTQSSRNIPNLSLLRVASTTTSNETEAESTNGQSKFSVSNQNELPPVGANIPLVSLLYVHENVAKGSETLESLVNTMTTTTNSSNSVDESTDVSTNHITSNNDNNLPIISELNLMGEQDNSRPDSEVNEVGVNGDDHNRYRNQSDSSLSNNDSSLTTVTDTSGDNSFELTNDSSLASNDDNIPDLSELQK